MACHTHTLEHNHLTQFLVCEFLCEPQACRRGPFRKRTLHMICTCLSLAALGLVSLAGCEVENTSPLKTETEIIQVPFLSEHLFRRTVVVAVEANQPNPWTVSFGNCTFSGDYSGAPLVRTGSCPTQAGSLDLQSKGIRSVPPDAFQGMSRMT